MKIKQLLLFLNASSYKLSIVIANFFNNSISNDKELALCFNIGLELCVLYLFKTLDIITSRWIVALIFFFFFVHLCIDFFFVKDLMAIKDNYSFYYKSWGFTIYCVLIVASVLYSIYVLFSRI